jgi:hypothetical protein
MIWSRVRHRRRSRRRFSLTTDFKDPPRVKDPTATRRALLRYPECLACGERASNGHHVLPVGRGSTGDDVIENIIGLCGTGTMRCHGAYHGNPYMAPVGPFRGERSGLISSYSRDLERRDREWVARRIGERLTIERPDVADYVLGKLGRDPGLAYLERNYYLEV